MTYAELKKTKTYRKAEDISLCVNNEEPIDEMYYPYQLDHLKVMYGGHKAKNDLIIIMECKNWDERYNPDWIAE